MQELASRAASLAMAEAAKKTTPPKSAYEFEVSWRGFSGDHALQASLLKVRYKTNYCSSISLLLTINYLLSVTDFSSVFFPSTTRLLLQLHYHNCLKTPYLHQHLSTLSNVLLPFSCK